MLIHAFQRIVQVYLHLSSPARNQPSAPIILLLLQIRFPRKGDEETVRVALLALNALTLGNAALPKVLAMHEVLCVIERLNEWMPYVQLRHSD